MRARVVFGVVLLLGLGTAAGPRARAAGVPELVVQNHTQWALLDVRVHETPSYADSPNLLEGPLALAAELSLPVSPTDLYVTVIREKVADGEHIALTTAYPIQARNGRYRLEVLDQEFRLRHDPDEAPSAAETGGCSTARPR